MPSLFWGCSVFFSLLWCAVVECCVVDCCVELCSTAARALLYRFHFLLCVFLSFLVRVSFLFCARYVKIASVTSSSSSLHLRISTRKWPPQRAVVAISVENTEHFAPTAPLQSSCLLDLLCPIKTCKASSACFDRAMFQITKYSHTLHLSL